MKQVMLLRLELCLMVHYFLIHLVSNNFKEMLSRSFLNRLKLHRTQVFFCVRNASTVKNEKFQELKKLDKRPLYLGMIIESYK